MKILQITALTSCILITGCTSTDYDQPISGSYAKINEMQILDPMAPENNEGIVNDLDGNYGKKVIESYQKGNYEAKDGRKSNVAGQASGG